MYFPYIEKRSSKFGNPKHKNPKAKYFLRFSSLSNPVEVGFSGHTYTDTFTKGDRIRMHVSLMSSNFCVCALVFLCLFCFGEWINPNFCQPIWPMIKMNPRILQLLIRHFGEKDHTILCKKFYAYMCVCVCICIGRPLGIKGFFKSWNDFWKTLERCLAFDCRCWMQDSTIASPPFFF